MIPILYISHYRSIIGGGEKQLYYLLTHLDKNKFHPIVICPNDGDYVQQLRNANISTVILKLPPWRKVRSYPTRHIAASKLADLVKKYKIKIIHISDPWLNPYVKRIKKHVKVPAISYVPNLLTPEQVAKYDFEYMDYIIAISEQSKAPIVKAGISPEKIEVITNCVDTSLFQPGPIKNRTDSDTFIVGIVGRIEPFKRQKTFIEIANQVFQRCKNVRFHIIGAAPNTPKHRRYENEVRQAVAEHKLENVVHFTGHRDDMPRAMQELDILVTLSAGSVIAEAMASGKPVIATSIGSAPDMIVDNVTGYVVPLDSTEKITDRIVQLVRDPARCIQMGKASRKHAEDFFSIQKHVQKVQKIYKVLF